MMIMRRQLAPTFTLALLSPFVAEFLLGDQYLTGDQGVGAQLGMFVVLGLWYGAGAVLVREVARRTGRGWPTILLLGLAFGLVEEGLLTQSLFNPHYLGLDLLSYGHLGALGVGLPWTIFVLTLHVVWSIATPIALTEGIWPGRDPWIGRIGLGVAVAVLILGAVAIAGVSWSSGGFRAAPLQLAVAGALAVVAAVVAVRLPRVHRPRPAGPIFPAVALALVLTSAFQLVQHYGPTLLPAWATTVILVVLLVAAVLTARVDRLDVLGLAVGAVLTYAWVGLTNAAPHGAAALAEQLVLVAVALVVAGVALSRPRRVRIRPNDPGAGAAATAASQRS